jgi:hypothetical protein
MPANPITGNSPTPAPTLGRRATTGKRGDHGGRRSRRAPGSQGLRFPCGHVEADFAVALRVRETARAVWITCRRCNLIATVWR